MSEMRARAAKAVQDWCEANNQCFPLYYEQALLREKRLEANEDAEDDLAEVSDAIGRAALLAALNPEDEELWDEIGCEIGGGSGDEAQAVEAALFVRLVVRELRKRITQGETSAPADDDAKDRA